MQPKIPSKGQWLIAGIVVLSATLFFLRPASPEPSRGALAGNPFQSAWSVDSGGQTGLELPVSQAGRPIRLKIPSLNVDASIEYVGLTPEGAMDVPEGPANVAWFNLGPRPGETGSAVVAGHEGWKNGIPAVFDNLNKLRKGDKIYVEDEKGTTTIFVVREYRTYGENYNASDVFYSDGGTSRLNLVTCEGVWNKSRKSYSNRYVVFTDRVDLTD